MKEIIRINSIGEVHRILGLEKPRHPLVSVMPLDSRVSDFDFGDATYVMDFYQISFKKGFSGSFGYGRNRYDFEEGSLIFTKPGQTIQVDDELEAQSSSGWILLFHPDLLRKSELGKTIDEYSFFDYDLNEALHLSEKEKNALTDLVEKIQEEYNQNIDKHSQELIIANIELMLKYSKRFYDRQFYTRTNHNQDILASFNKVLRSYYRSEQPLTDGVLSVKSCAEQLNLSVNYLGDLMKAETGRSAKDLINDYVVERAKTRLLGTNDSISEIAYGLGFEYPQGLNKLFKSKVGVSPTQFRNLN